MRTAILPFGLLVLGITGLLASTAVAPPQAAAQSGNDPWATPVNLSHSGAAINPAMVIDASQVIHVLWKDRFAGYVYARFAGSQWSHPQPGLGSVFGSLASQTTAQTVPQPTRDASFNVSPGSGPRFIASSGGYILAVWIPDRTGWLYASRVLSEGFANASAWDKPVLLATSVIAADVAVDDAGHVYLAYVRNVDSPDSPAGVYFQTSGNNGSVWSAPVALDQSPYFRTLTSDLANVEIATADTPQTARVYVVWDNRPRKQVLFVRSTDGGSNWTTPAQIDGATAGSVATGPFAIRIGAASSNILLMWQNGQPGTSCTQLYKWSSDGGSTWSERQPVVLGIPSCAQSDQIMVSRNLMFLVTTIYGQTYLQAWNGTRWSLPQSQPALFSFEDPEIYSPVEYGCRQFTLSQGRLYVVGCDTGAGGDIWLTSQSLGAVDNWFAAPGVWSTPQAIATMQAAAASPLLVAGPEDRLHTLWVQADQLSTAAAQTAIYYAGWDGARWSRAAPVLRSPQGNVFDPAAALDSRGRLLVVWRGDQPPGIYFSWADARQPYSAADWSPSVMMTALSDGAIAPTIAVDEAGVISVAYAKAINEGRGIYVTQSKDQGKTWSKPLQVFDGAAAGWEMVGNPVLTSTSNGILLLHWSRASLSQSSNAGGLYFARSTDGGNAWSTAQAVVDAPITWWQVANSGGLQVYRVWIESRPGGQNLNFQSSQDGGASWTNSSSQFIVSTAHDPISLAAVVSAQPQLVQIKNGDRGLEMLQQWNWDTAQWEDSVSLGVGQQGTVHVNALSAAVSAGRSLGVIVAASTLSETTGSSDSRLLYLSRPITLTTTKPDQTPVFSTATAPAATPSGEPTLVATVQTTATPDLSGIGQVAGGLPSGSPSSNGWSALTIALGLSTALTVMVFVFRLLVLRATR